MSYNINDLLLRLDEEAERIDRMRMYVEEGTKERNHKN